MYTRIATSESASPREEAARLHWLQHCLPILNQSAHDLDDNGLIALFVDFKDDNTTCEVNMVFHGEASFNRQDPTSQNLCGTLAYRTFNRSVYKRTADIKRLTFHDVDLDFDFHAHYAVMPDTQRPSLSKVHSSLTVSTSSAAKHSAFAASVLSAGFSSPASVLLGGNTLTETSSTSSPSTSGVPSTSDILSNSSISPSSHHSTIYEQLHHQPSLSASSSVVKAPSHARPWKSISSPDFSGEQNFDKGDLWNFCFFYSSYIHYSMNVEINEWTLDGFRPILFLNTCNHMFATVNRNPTLPKYKWIHYPVLKGSRDVAEHFGKHFTPPKPTCIDPCLALYSIPSVLSWCMGSVFYCFSDPSAAASVKSSPYIPSGITIRDDASEVSSGCLGSHEASDAMFGYSSHVYGHDLPEGGAETELGGSNFAKKIKKKNARAQTPVTQAAPFTSRAQSPNTTCEDNASFEEDVDDDIPAEVFRAYRVWPYKLLQLHPNNPYVDVCMHGHCAMINTGVTKRSISSANLLNFVNTSTSSITDAGGLKDDDLQTPIPASISIESLGKDEDGGGNDLVIQTFEVETPATTIVTSHLVHSDSISIQYVDQPSNADDANPSYASR